MSSDQKPTTKADMMAAFPEPPAKIQGEPTLRELLRVLDHLMTCSQMHNYDLSTCNLLYIFIPEILYAKYTNEAYPQDSRNPGPIPT